MLKKKLMIATGALVIIVGAALYFYNTKLTSQTPGKYDEFAKCLTEKGVKMFGAYWCPHCQNQKKEFGDSWKYVDYIECSLPNGSGQTVECRDQKIEGYPTWEFSGGERISGEVPFDTLAEKSGCPL